MLRKNVSGQFIYFALVNASTGAALSGATVSVRRSIDGTFAAGGGTVTEDTGLGFYKYALSQADTNGNNLGFFFTATSAIPVEKTVITTAADPTTATNFGLSALPTANPGATNGLFIAGTNAAVTISSSGDALTITSSGGNGNGINVSGNGTGDAVKATGGATGNALELIGGGTSGDGLKVTTTSGHGMNIAATGTSKHGITATGGNAGTSDGIKGVAGTGGVDIRGNITGNVTGNLSGSVGSVTARVTANSDQLAGVSIVLDANNLLKVDVEDWKGATAPANTGDAFARLGAPTGASVSADVAAVKTDTAAIKAKTDNLPAQVKKNTALANFEFLMTDSTNHTPVTGKTVAVTRSIDNGAFAAGTLSVVTEISNGIYSVDFGAGDLNGGVITLRATATGCDDLFVTLVTNT